MTKINFVDRVISIGIIIMLVITSCIAIIMIAKYLAGNETCDMRFENTKLDGIKGVWSFSEEEEYMCVSLKGRSEKEIAETVCHECDHHYVNEDRAHYCG